MKLLRILDDFLNSLTMYRLLLYGLSLLAAVALGLSASGRISLEATDMLEALVILIPAAYLTNKFMAKAWNAPTNSESWLITALILFFILPPPTSTSRLAGLLVASIIAMASKYILAWRHKHIFNPAALAAVSVGWLGLAPASWWVASSAMLPFTVVLGLLVVRKLRRFRLALSFTIASLATLLLVGLGQSQQAGTILSQAFTSWPIIFLGCIMLTEPSTLPPFGWQQMAYGVLVGIIFGSQVQLGPIATTPALALLCGNLYAFAVSPKYRLRLRLRSKVQVSAHIYDFTFVPERQASFIAGQYAEWTLPHQHTDSRGNRRTFSIASSPTQQEIHIGTKMSDPSSSFKRALLQMEPGGYIVAGQFAGDFILPKNKSRKLVFVAGGIGITPFISMLNYMVDTRQQRDIVLFYIVRSVDDIAYREFLASLDGRGVRVIPVLTANEIPAGWKGRTGHLTSAVLAEAVPDFKARTFYISGPDAMVAHYRHLLRSQNIPRRHIVTDYFSGY